MQKEFLKIPEVKEAMDELSALSMDKATRAEYEARIKELNDFHASNSTSYEKEMEKGIKKGREEEKQIGEAMGIEKGREEGKAEGIKEGVEKGKAEGAHEKALKTAMNLLKMRLPIEQVAQATGLLIEEVKESCR